MYGIKTKTTSEQKYNEPVDFKENEIPYLKAKSGRI